MNSYIYISTQTACSTGNYSIAIYALTHDEERSSSSMRVSISHLTTKEEIDKLALTQKRIMIVLNDPCHNPTGFCIVPQPKRRASNTTEAANAPTPEGITIIYFFK